MTQKVIGLFVLQVKMTGNSAGHSVPESDAVGNLEDIDQQVMKLFLNIVCTQCMSDFTRTQLDAQHYQSVLCTLTRYQTQPWSLLYATVPHTIHVHCAAASAC